MDAVQEKMEDEVKQVELLQTNYLRYLESQDKQYTDLNSKITFLFGFVVVVLTFYGTYAKHTNHLLRIFALVLFGITALLLCLAYRNREYSRPHKLDSSLGGWSYAGKVYKDAKNIKRTCEDNVAPLEDMAMWVRWSIWVFTLGLLLLIASFV